MPRNQRGDTLNFSNVGCRQDGVSARRENSVNLFDESYWVENVLYDVKGGDRVKCSVGIRQRLLIDIKNATLDPFFTGEPNGLLGYIDSVHFPELSTEPVCQ